MKNFFLNKKKAHQEHEFRRKEQKKDEEKLRGAAEVEAERIRLGGINYSLFNLALTIVDFKSCTTLTDGCRTTYEGLYPYIQKMAKENQALRKLCDKGTIGRMSNTDVAAFREIEKTWCDPQVMAQAYLDKVREAAKQRARAGIYSEKGKRGYQK